MSNSVRRFLSNSVLLLGNQLVMTAAGILVAFEVIDYLGAYRFGVYSTVLAFASFFGVFTSSSGVEDLAIADCAHDVEGSASPLEYLSTAFALRLALGAAACVTAVTVAWAIGYRGHTFWLMALYSISMLFSFHSRNGLLSIDFIVRERRAVPELVTFAATIGVLLVKYGMTKTEAALAWFVAADVILILGVSTILFAIARARGAPLLRLNAARRNIAHSLAKRAIPLAIGALLISIFLRVDQVMLSRLMSMADVGIYSVAVKLVESLNFVPVIAGSLLLPIYSRHLGSENQPRLFRLSFRASAWAALLLTACLTLFGEDLLRFLWQERFLESLVPMRMLVWSIPLVFLGTLNGPMVIVLGLQRYTMVFNVVQTALNIGLNLVLIPQYGLTGAALSTLASYGSGFVLMLGVPATRVLAVPAWREALPLFCFVAAMLYGRSGQPLLDRWIVLLLMLTMTATVVLSAILTMKRMKPADRVSSK